MLESFMVSVRGRSRRLESAVSIFILCLLAFIAAFLAATQLETRGAEPDLASLAPNGFRAWRLEEYDAGNLYEKINGKAPLYTDAGFVKLSTVRFAAGDDEEMMMEAYLFDMGSARGAFSVYSMQKRADADALQGMEFGYRTSNGLYFARGKYYVEVVGYSESAELMSAMEELAEKLAGALQTQGNTGLAEIDSLPDEGKIAGSVTFYLSSAFGCEGLTEIFTCTYRSGTDELTAFLRRRSGEAEAAKMAKMYHDFLISNGARPKKAMNEELEGKVLDFYGYIEIVVPAGSFLAGVHEARNQEAAEKLVLRIVEGLKE